jgi:hypothetical protein
MSIVSQRQRGRKSDTLWSFLLIFGIAKHLKIGAPVLVAKANTGMVCFYYESRSRPAGLVSGTFDAPPQKVAEPAGG